MFNIFGSSDKRAAIFSINLVTVREFLKCKEVRQELEGWYDRVDDKLKGNMSLAEFAGQLVKYVTLHEWLCSMACDNQLRKFRKALITKDKNWLFAAKCELYLRLRNGIYKNPTSKKVDPKFLKELGDLIQHLNI